ncbi:hypothetical protein [Actibacterium sp. 188UL27-1]|uniref:hypothetical protein n=1 Tax=Actibacterium sp. 188UL27-1 TaxID=2786961 RepID=UPI0019581514|nr:hypothetical protein [Actibacterium sp. 188UL27-1]MBM7067797.1 hypothetical protein [Actibacterium sp. 188UL27-1]
MQMILKFLYSFALRLLVVTTLLINVGVADQVFAAIQGEPIAGSVAGGETPDDTPCDGDCAGVAMTCGGGCASNLLTLSIIPFGDLNARQVIDHGTAPLIGIEPGFDPDPPKV